MELFDYLRCSITSGVVTRRSARSVRPSSNGELLKRRN